MTINLEDGRKELFQWDTGRTLVIEDSSIEQVHFSNSRFGTAIVVNVENGLAAIPDELLQTPKSLYAWAFVGGGQCGYTKIERVFPVAPRNKPANYVYTPVKQDSLYELRMDLGDLDELETQSKDSMVAAVNELRKEGNLLREMSDRAVKTVNGAEPDESGNVEITAGVQPDWNQNDETALDYVKNRPGGYTEVVFGEPIETTVTFTADTSGQNNYISEIDHFERGAVCNVEIDGVLYENVPAQGSSIGWYLGDPELKEYPFVLNYPEYAGGGMYARYSLHTDPGEKNVVVTEKTVTTTKIPAELVDIPAAEMQESISEAQTTADKSLDIAYGAKEDAKNLTGQHDWKQSNITTGRPSLVRGNDVLVITDGSLSYTTDGIKWEVPEEKPDGTYNIVGYGCGRFVAWDTSNKTVIYSDNGKTWQAGTNATNGLYPFTMYAGDGTWVATASSGKLLGSSNGSFWYATSFYADSVIYANGIWLSIKSASSAPVKYCTDGVRWQDTNLTFSYNSMLSAVAYANGLYVLSAGNSGLYYSTDGISWTQSNVEYYSYQYITYGNGVWVAAGRGGIYYSDDGMAWTQVPNFYGNTEFCKYANGIWVLVYSRNPYYSYDGKTWSEGYFSDNSTGFGYSLSSLSFHNGVWMTSTLYYSIDGKAWAKCAYSSANYEGSVSYIEDVWVASNELKDDGIFYATITPKYATPADLTTLKTLPSTTAADAGKILQVSADGAWVAEGTALTLKSSTKGSTKRFRITVDDSGTLSATEITTEDND